MLTAPLSVLCLCKLQRQDDAVEVPSCPADPYPCGHGGPARGTRGPAFGVICGGSGALNIMLIRLYPVEARRIFHCFFAENLSDVQYFLLLNIVMAGAECRPQALPATARGIHFK